MGRLINCGLLLLALLLIGSLLGAPGVFASIACFCFAGFVWAQSASVTNDFPMSIYGLLFGSLVGALIVESSVKARVVMGLILITLLPLLAKIDRSWFSLPLVWPIVVLTLLVSSRLFEGFSRRWWAYGVIFFASGALVFLSFCLMPWLANHWGGYLPAELQTSLQTALTWEELKAAFAAWKITIKSIFGSFLWGHAYYPFWINLLLAGVICAAILIVLLRATSLRSRVRSLGLCAAHGAGLMLILVGMVVVGRYFKHTDIPSEYWAKPRLLAGPWLLVVLPVWKMSFDAYENEQLRAIIFRGIAGVTMVIAMIVLPQMFLIGIF